MTKLLCPYDIIVPLHRTLYYSENLSLEPFIGTVFLVEPFPPEPLSPVEPFLPKPFLPAPFFTGTGLSETDFLLVLPEALLTGSFTGIGPSGTGPQLDASVDGLFAAVVDMLCMLCCCVATRIYNWNVSSTEKVNC